MQIDGRDAAAGEERTVADAEPAVSDAVDSEGADRSTRSSPDEAVAEENGLNDSGIGQDRPKPETRPRPIVVCM